GHCPPAPKQVGGVLELVQWSGAPLGVVAGRGCGFHVTPTPPLAEHPLRVLAHTTGPHGRCAMPRGTVSRVASPVQRLVRLSEIPPEHQEVRVRPGGAAFPGPTPSHIRLSPGLWAHLNRGIWITAAPRCPLPARPIRPK